MLTRLKQLSQAIKWQQKKNYTMAWYCSGSTNTELVDNLFKVGLIQNEQVKEAMLGVSNPCSPDNLHCQLMYLLRSIGLIMPHLGHTPTRPNQSGMGPRSRHHTCMAMRVST